jgi:hypothetical protein
VRAPAGMATARRAEGYTVHWRVPRGSIAEPSESGWRVSRDAEP